jgi:signal transduction histidine kinase
MDAPVLRHRVAILVPATLGVLLGAFLAVDGIGHGSPGLELLLSALGLLGLPLALRRRPLLALVLVWVLSALLLPGVRSDAVGYVAVVAIDVAVGLLAAARSWRVSVPGAQASLVLEGTLAALNSGSRSSSFLLVEGVLALAMICAWTVGNSVRERRRYALARSVEETERAVAAERLRIARELHDLVAHSMGVIAIQAGVGSRVLEHRPEEARNALDAIETISRQALAELRRTLTALRRSEPEGAPVAPLPGLADLDRLVATARNAGVEVEVERADVDPSADVDHVAGPDHPGDMDRLAGLGLPADLDLAAYRIVQEAVTNVVRHAGTDRCRVRLDRRADGLAIEVLDDGPGSGTPGTGYGLVGMRERVSLLGGDFTAGVRPEGGFRVAALIPVHQ